MSIPTYITKFSDLGEYAYWEVSLVQSTVSSIKTHLVILSAARPLTTITGRQQGRRRPWHPLLQKEGARKARGLHSGLL